MCAMSRTYTVIAEVIRAIPRVNINNIISTTGSIRIGGAMPTPIIIESVSKTMYEMPKVMNCVVTEDVGKISLANAIFVTSLEFDVIEWQLAFTDAEKKLYANIPVEIYSQ